MRDSDWSRKFLLRSDWSGPSVASITTQIKLFLKQPNNLFVFQGPKRIDIREIPNGAYVDEIVDIKNEREWELLNYMAPLRHISSQPEETSYSLRFQDLRNFDVYYYPLPWR